jgi:hypothetical protein
MVESILDNEVQINRALMVTGNRELTISSMEKTQLQDLRTFLKPFENFTKLVSGSVPHLGLVTLIRHEIQQISKVNDRDSAFLKDVKRLVAAKLDTRVPETEMTRLATLLDPSMSSTLTEVSHDVKVGPRLNASNIKKCVVLDNLLANIFESRFISLEISMYSGESALSTTSVELKQTAVAPNILGLKVSNVSDSVY